MKQRVGDLVVYLQEERAFGWEYAEPAESGLPVGLVFVVQSITERYLTEGAAEKGQILDVVPLGVAATSEQPRRTFLAMHCVGLDELPPFRMDSRDVRWTARPCLEVHGRTYPLHFRSSSATAPDMPRRSLELSGFSLVDSYHIEQWLVPDKVLTLKGFKGAFYSGLFDSD